jgi:hypothetical protein
MRMMAPNLDELRADLVERWKRAFGRFDEATAKAEGAVETAYTEYPAFALEGYTPKKFKPGARLKKERIEDGYAFELDAKKRPLRVRFAHRVNRVSWRGFFRYADDEVESVEYCVETRVPSLYNRLILEGGGVLAEQRFVCNSGGHFSGLAGKSAAANAARILSDPTDFFIYITRYELENGVPVAAEEHHEVSGETYRPTRTYSYAGDELERVVQHWPGGETRTLFAVKSKTSTKALSERLSEAIAKAVVARVREWKLGAPLVALELSYREHDARVPILVPLTADDRPSSLALSAEIDASRWITLSEEDFAPDIADFGQRVEESGSATAVAKRLRTAALTVTETARSLPNVADDFVAYAIDWELEGDELAKILKQCGASRAKLTEWKKKKWL